MASYEQLPIYKAAPDMTVHFEKLVAGSASGPSSIAELRARD
jgi:hypothetical protein